MARHKLCEMNCTHHPVEHGLGPTHRCSDYELIPLITDDGLKFRRCLRCIKEDAIDLNYTILENN